MIFTTKCSDGKDRKFQVFFAHKNKTCTCEIWEMTGFSTNELEHKYPNSIVRGCPSQKHPDTVSKLLLSKAIAVCAETDNYVYAYGRALALKRALRGLTDRFYDSNSVEYVIKDPIPYTFDNTMFRKFMHELRVQCPQGLKEAKRLQTQYGYNHIEWHN